MTTAKNFTQTEKWACKVSHMTFLFTYVVFSVSFSLFPMHIAHAIWKSVIAIITSPNIQMSTVRHRGALRICENWYSVHRLQCCGNSSPVLPFLLLQFVFTHNIIFQTVQIVNVFNNVPSISEKHCQRLTGRKATVLDLCWFIFQGPVPYLCFHSKRI